MPSFCIKAERQLFNRMLDPECFYKKAGVMLLDLQKPSATTGDLFSNISIVNGSLNNVIDGINDKFGRGTITHASTGLKSKPAWGMRQGNLSPRYTASFNELPLLDCHTRHPKRPMPKTCR